MKNRMEIAKYIVLGAVIAFTILFVTGQLKMTEKYESEGDIQAEIDKLLSELDAGVVTDVAASDSEADSDSDSDSDDESDAASLVGMGPGPM